MSLLNYKGYTGSVEFSQEDNCLYGKVLSSLRNHTVADLFSVCRQTFIAKSRPQQQDSE